MKITIFSFALVLTTAAQAHADVLGYIQSRMFRADQIESLRALYQHPFMADAAVIRTGCYDRLTGGRSETLSFRDVEKRADGLTVRARNIGLKPFVTQGESTWSVSGAGIVTFESTGIPMLRQSIRVQNGYVISEGTADGQAYQTITKYQFEPGGYWISEKTYDSGVNPRLTSSSLCYVEIAQGSTRDGNHIFARRY